MNKNIFYKTVFFLLLLLTVLFSGAQQRITVKAIIDRTKILIGEPIRLKLEADIPENEPIRFFNIDSMDHFEWLDLPAIDTVNTAAGTILTRTITLTSFDSGHWVIPSFILAENIATDSIPVDVGFSSPFDPNKEYHDIKDIIEPEPPKKNDWLWYAVGAAILLLPVLLYLLTRKKKPVAAIPAAVLNPYEEAMKELEKIKEEKPESRQYYSRVVNVLRVYIFQKKGILSLQKTTDDLVIQLKDLELNKEQFDKLAQSLRLSDSVKFAKYIPTSEDDTNSFDAIKNAIITIEKSGSGSPYPGGS